MADRDYRDIAGGVLVLAGGVALAAFSWASFEMGTIRRMGPGMYPFGLGVLMAGLGLAIALPALRRPGPGLSVRFWSPLFVLASIAAFAWTIPRFGLIPAVAVQVVIASMAELRFRPLGIAALAAAMCAIGYVVFAVLLGLPIRPVRWPF